MIIVTNDFGIRTFFGSRINPESIAFFSAPERAEFTSLSNMALVNLKIETAHGSHWSYPHVTS